MRYGVFVVAMLVLASNPMIDDTSGTEPAPGAATVQAWSSQQAALEDKSPFSLLKAVEVESSTGTAIVSTHGGEGKDASTANEQASEISAVRIENWDQVMSLSCGFPTSTKDAPDRAYWQVDVDPKAARLNVSIRVDYYFPKRAPGPSFGLVFTVDQEGNVLNGSKILPGTLSELSVYETVHELNRAFETCAKPPQ